MRLDHAQYTLEIDELSGSITSLRTPRRELLFAVSGHLPLFLLSLRLPNGEQLVVSSQQAQDVVCDLTQQSEGQHLYLTFTRIAGLALNVQVRVRAPVAESLTYWHLALEHQTTYTVEWIDFPAIAVSNDFIAAGGPSRLLWPAMEGTLVEDAFARERTWLRYEAVEYPSKGWEGFYPGCCSQVMAYYDDQDGMYFAAHDANHHSKAIEKFPSMEGIRLQFKLFPGAVEAGLWQMDYEMVLGVFTGDWYKAAMRYRQWYQSTLVSASQTVAASSSLPAWYHQSPLIICYPVRGTKDTGAMSPNALYRYEHALPMLDRFVKQLGAPVMALWMHWEGTAPWASPYVWPPADLFKAFITAAHEHGHLVGVYGSGIGWTQESLLIPYTRRPQFAHEGFDMCLARACAELFREHRNEIDSVLVTQPNFGDERAIANVLRWSDLHVPVLIHAFSDDPQSMSIDNRRDSFCGKMSACNNMRQYGIPYTLTSQYTMDPTSKTFAADLKAFAGICRVTRGLKTARIGALDARPTNFNTVHYSEKLLEQSGISVETLDLSEVFGRIAALANDAPVVVTQLAAMTQLAAIQKYADASTMPAVALLKMAKFDAVLDGWITEHQLDATAIQCWTAMEEYFGVVPCTLMSMASTGLIPAACETDVVAMLALQLASGKPSAIMDWNNNDGADWTRATSSTAQTCSKTTASMRCQRWTIRRSSRGRWAARTPMAPSWVGSARTRSPTCGSAPTTRRPDGHDARVCQGGHVHDPLATFGAMGW